MKWQGGRSPNDVAGLVLLFLMWVATVAVVLRVLATHDSSLVPNPIPPVVSYLATPVLVATLYAVVVIPTVAPTDAPTPWPIATLTQSFVETLPLCDQATPGHLCAPMRPQVMPTETPYQECTRQSYHDSFEALKPCVKPIPTPTPGGVFK